MTDPALAALVARRLCHDFAGPLGAITTALDMLGDGGDTELVALVADSADALSARLRLYRFIAAPLTEGAGGETARALLADWLVSREGYTLNWHEGEAWPAAVAELTAGLAMVAAEAAPRGGILLVTAGEARLEASTIIAAEDLSAVLGGSKAASTDKLAIAGLLAAQSAAVGRIIKVERGDGWLTLRLG